MTQHFEQNKNMVQTEDNHLHLLDTPYKRYANESKGKIFKKVSGTYCFQRGTTAAEILYTTDPSLKGVKQLPRDMFVREVDVNKLAQKHADETFVWPLNKNKEPMTIPAGQSVPNGYRKHCDKAIRHFKAGYNANKGEFTENELLLAFITELEYPDELPVNIEHYKSYQTDMFKVFLNSLRPLSLPQSLTIENDKVTNVKWD